MPEDPCRCKGNGIFIRVQDYYRKILYDDILWLESSGHYTTVGVRGKGTVLVCADLKRLHDHLPPSRFVRAAFYQASSPVQATARKTVLQAFQILNNFDIPVGIEFPDGKVPADIPSATQWTSATDVRNLVFYYRTMWNSAIRSIDLKAIDFSKVKYRSAPVDEVKEQPIVPLALK